jgi:hypothetical protein
MPRGGTKGDGRAATMIKVAAELKHQQMLARLATGKRTCPRCSQCKPLTDYGPAPSTASGFGGWCRSCVAEDARERRRWVECQRCRRRRPPAEYAAEYGDPWTICAACRQERTQYRRCADCGQRCPADQFTGQHGQQVTCCQRCRTRKADTQERVRLARGGKPRCPDQPADPEAAAAATRWRPARIEAEPWPCCSAEPVIRANGTVAGFAHQRSCPVVLRQP